MFKKLPNSTRKFIRSEKARIRRQFLNYKQQEEAIANMYNKILNQPVAKDALGRNSVGEAELLRPVKAEIKQPKKHSAVSKKVKQEKKNTKKYKKKKSK